MNELKEINNVEVGKRIKGLAKKNKFSIVKISMDTSLSEATVSRMNRGISLTKDNIGIIAKYYNVKVDYILYGDQESCDSEKGYYLSKLEKLNAEDLKKLYNIAVAAGIEI